MRYKGTLIEWHDDRGYGFARWQESDPKVFVHIGQFQNRSRRPASGDRITYILGYDADHRPQATDITYVDDWGDAEVDGRSSRQVRRALRRAPFLLVLLGAVLAIQYFPWPAALSQPPAVEEDETPWRDEPVRYGADREEPDEPAGTFRCEGKTRCPQMRSCAEATFYLNHCPNVTIDGDHDGVPCEDQHCR